MARASSRRHFEKKTGLFRRIETSGATVRLAIGKASKGTTHVSVKCRSRAEAERLAATWSRWALEAGFAEIALERGTPGILFHLAGPRGPGRVRDDEGRNVFFDEGAALAPSLKQGQRVVLEGVKRNARLDVPFLFGSKLEAARLLAFPRPLEPPRAPRELDAKTRRELVRRAGDAISGKQVRARPLADVPCGSLVFGYERGVHRFLKTEEWAAEGPLVLYEPVLTSGLKRQSGEVLSCIARFCELVPAPIVRELDRKLGLGLPR